MGTVTIGANVLIEDNVAATRAGGFYLGTFGVGWTGMCPNWDANLSNISSRPTELAGTINIGE